MSWWCAAQSVPWEWTWRAYPGVWLIVLLLAVGYAVGLRAMRRRGESAPPAHIASFTLGVLVLWLASDWPIGALGAGYLVSVHTAQYLLYTLVAAPLLLHGFPEPLLRRCTAAGPPRAIARAASRPLVAFLVFNVVMLGTHLPPVVDGLGESQLGTFAIDMAWLVSGLFFWWPVLVPLPELRALPYPGRILYLVLNVFIPTVPASFLTFADYPLYALYELAPPIEGISAVTDQRVAGLLMKVVGGFVIFGAASVLFFKWHAAEREDRAEVIVAPMRRGAP